MDNELRIGLQFLENETFLDCLFRVPIVVLSTPTQFAS